MMFEGVLTALVTPFREGVIDEPALRDLVERTASPADDGELAALMELVLEGLHQGSLLSRDDDGNNRRAYGDMLAQMARSLGA